MRRRTHQHRKQSEEQTLKRQTLLTFIASAALALATVACTGAADDPTAEPAQNGQPVATTPAGTSAATPGAAAPGVANAAVQEVTIVSADGMRFDPATLTVEAGRPVHLTLRNTGQATHDFSLSQGVARPVKAVARGGETASVTFTITRPGTYQFVCDQLGHSMAGMKGTITATAAGSAAAG
jgi:plastocyanin